MLTLKGQEPKEDCHLHSIFFSLSLYLIYLCALTQCINFAAIRFYCIQLFYRTLLHLASFELDSLFRQVLLILACSSITEYLGIKIPSII